MGFVAGEMFEAPSFPVRNVCPLWPNQCLTNCRRTNCRTAGILNETVALNKVGFYTTF